MTAKFLKQIELVKSSCIELNLILPEELLIETAQELGPSIFSTDSKLVNTSDKTELQLIKDELLKGKLKLPDDVCDKLLTDAIRIIEPLKNKKYRILFYAVLKDMAANLETNVKVNGSQSIFQKIKGYFFK
jgi:hypothetical protein